MRMIRRKDLHEGNIYVLRDGREVGLLKRGWLYHLVSHSNNEYEYTCYVPTDMFFCEVGEYYNRLRGVYGDEID